MSFVEIVGIGFVMLFAMLTVLVERNNIVSNKEYILDVAILTMLSRSVEGLKNYFI